MICPCFPSLHTKALLYSFLRFTFMDRTLVLTACLSVWKLYHSSQHDTLWRITNSWFWAWDLCFTCPISPDSPSVLFCLPRKLRSIVFITELLCPLANVMFGQWEVLEGAWKAGGEWDCEIYSSHFWILAWTILVVTEYFPAKLLPRTPPARLLLSTSCQNMFPLQAC
jgi:hypothetical protein